MVIQELWLIHRSQQGDTAAFASLYERYYRTVFRTALYLVRDSGLAEDITQEAFITAFKEITRLRTPAAFRTWLYRLVVSRTTRALRNEGRPRSVSLDLLPESQVPADLDPAKTVEDDEEVSILRTAIAELPVDLRLVVLLHYFSGLRVAEVGQVLGIPAGTVKSRLYTARCRLAAALDAGSYPRHTVLVREVTA